jgi:predicted transposase/invertase (TIGR01784 family)
MEKEQPLHQPSDKLVKATFADPANAAGFFQAHLEASVASSVDWGSLRLESSSFVDAQMAGSESDLLFSANTSGGEALLYLLFEHQSREDAWMSLRLLRYMVRVWERKSEQKSSSAGLSPILPVVLTQSAHSWRKAARFHALFSETGPAWETAKAFTPDFCFRLVQLRDLGFGEIRGTPGGILTLRALKAWSSGELLSDEVWDEELMGQLSADALQRLLRYVYSGEVDKADFRHKVRRIRDFKLQDTTMTLEQQFREEGKLEGKLEGKREALLATLESRFGALPQGLTKEVQGITGVAPLDRLFLHALGCASLDEFSRAL